MHLIAGRQESDGSFQLSDAVTQDVLERSKRCVIDCGIELLKSLEKEPQILKGFAC